MGSDLDFGAYFRFGCQTHNGYIHLFNRYWLSIYEVLGVVLFTRNIARNIIKYLFYTEFIFRWEELYSKQL